MKDLQTFYKPRGISSFQLVSRVRRLIGEKKIGHGGTLDPLAEGLMILGIGREGTKKLASVLNKEKKEYEAVFRLGAVSKTYDSEGPITKISNDEFLIPKQKIEETLNKFIGEIEQIP
ncbi:MAG: tRNA pseudouridine(55) synthase TruB, partial [bacterium]|nr:tRNA pseudouridine(55) synthase TruB [bacterium]